jgi:hypothetical protein
MTSWRENQEAIMKRLVEICSYASLEDLQARQDAFYGSDAWRKGPRESIVSLIESYLNTVLWLSPPSIEDLRESQSPK